MFKNYLSYQFALSFHQACMMLEAPPSLHQELTTRSGQVVDRFVMALRTTDAKERLKHLCVALLQLRDCRDFLHQSRIPPKDALGKWEVLHARLERLALDAADAEGGQLRLFG
jgi:hypothetical protein